MMNIYLIIIFFILLLLVIYSTRNNNIEKFTGLLDILSSNNTMINNLSNVSNNSIGTIDTIDSTNISQPNIIINNTNNFPRNIKYIYLKKIENNNKYLFYNKNNDVYLSFLQSENNYQKKVIIKDLQNNIIGNLISHIYNKIIIKTSLYKKNINIDFSDNFQTVKIYLDNDEKNFNIIKKDNNYIINNYMENIGKIKYDNTDNIYKIMVYEEYKIYLNLIAIGFIVLLNN